MHAKYQVAIFNISKDMTKVKVSTTLWSHIFDQVVIFNIKKVINYCKSLTKVKVFNRMTDRQAKNNIPPILRSEHNNPLLNLNEFQTHKVRDIIFTWLNVAVYFLRFTSWLAVCDVSWRSDEQNSWLAVGDVSWCADGQTSWLAVGDVSWPADDHTSWPAVGDVSWPVDEHTYLLAVGDVSWPTFWFEGIKLLTKNNKMPAFRSMMCRLMNYKIKNTEKVKIITYTNIMCIGKAKIVNMFVHTFWIEIKEKWIV